MTALQLAFRAVSASVEEACSFMIRNSTTNWGSVSRLFHWSLGFVIIGMLAYGWWMNHMAARPDRLFHCSIHADIGYVVLLLMVIRPLTRSSQLTSPSGGLRNRITGCTSSGTGGKAFPGSGRQRPS